MADLDLYDDYEPCDHICEDDCYDELDDYEPCDHICEDDCYDELDEYEPCDHICEDDCYDELDEWVCLHQHCWSCGECGCAGYCDDYQTYNLRPAETGGPQEPGVPNA